MAILLDRGTSCMALFTQGLILQPLESEMKVASVREFKDRATQYLKDREPILVTRHGKVAGLYLPIEHAEKIPFDLRKELIVRLGEAISRSLGDRGISEDELTGDFKAFKKTLT